MNQTRAQSVVYIGSLSFEERCLGVLRALARRPRSLTGVILDYGSEATFGTDAARLRQENWRQVEGLASAHGWRVERVESQPYSMSDIELWLSSLVLEGGTRLVVDISCMTKVHVVGAAVGVASSARQADVEWTVAYSQPQNYGSVAGSYKAGWRGTLVVGLGASSTLRNEGLGLGLMLPGAEAERSLIALDELEASAGALAFIITKNRPDIHLTTKSLNAPMVDYLTRQKLAGPRVESSGLERFWPGSGWRSLDLSELTLVEDMQALASSLVAAAKELDGPVVLYPVGPKDAVFAASLFLAANYVTASWIVYPVLATHPIDYSEGVRAVRWLDAAQFAGAGYFPDS